MFDKIRSKIGKHLAKVPATAFRESYARDRLDAKLEGYLPKRKGFFIEAGANDGVSQSNTLRFERYSGWKGLLVEPVPEFAAKCRATRAACIVEEVALVASPGMETVEIAVAGLMSTVSGSFGGIEGYSRELHLERAEEYYPDVSKNPKMIQVKAMTLSQILDHHQIQSVDLLSLDVEGFEKQALQGIDFSRHKPRFILAEERNHGDLLEILDRHYKIESVLAYSPTYQDTLYALR